MNQLRRFFESDKKRVFAPDAYFTDRVMARLNEAPAWEHGIWEISPRSMRPAVGMALALLVCFVFVELLIPQMRQYGVVELFLECDLSASDSFVFKHSG